MFGVVPRVIWSRYIKPDEDNLIPLSLRSLIIDTGEQVILIDNGIGNKQGKKFLKHLYIYGGIGLETGIQSLGYSVNDITDVILTHLHFDHCGGGVQMPTKGEYTLTFPKAKYWVSRQQWENAMNPNPREADSFLPENLLPMQDLGALRFVEKAGVLYPGIELRLVHGHTPGQLIPIIRQGEKSMLFCADLFPTRAHIPVKYNMAYDLEVLKSMKEKEAFLAEFAHPDCAFFFEHDVDVACGLVHNTIKGYLFDQPVELNSWFI